MNIKTMKIEDLIVLIEKCDDSAGHHILWVDFQGNVFIDLLAEKETPIEFENKMNGKLKFRYETYGRGNGYVGKKASEDLFSMNILFKDLLKDWEDNRTGYIDY